MSVKTSNLRIRIAPELHKAFIDTCKAQDRVASEVLRDFMRAYVDQNAGGRQQTLLFAGGDHNDARS